MMHPDLLAAVAAEHRRDLLQRAQARARNTPPITTGERARGRRRHTNPWWLGWRLQSPIVRRSRPAAVAMTPCPPAG